MIDSWSLITWILYLQVAFDVIEEICTEMGVHRDEAYNEYAIFAVTNRGKWRRRCLTLLGCSVTLITGDRTLYRIYIHRNNKAEDSISAETT